MTAAPLVQWNTGVLLDVSTITDDDNVMIANASIVQRLRYTTTQFGTEKPALATVFHLTAGDQPLQLLAYTHGTVGVGKDCTPWLRMGRGDRYDLWLGPWLGAGCAIVVPHRGGIGIDN